MRVRKKKNNFFKVRYIILVITIVLVLVSVLFYTNNQNYLAKADVQSVPPNTKVAFIGDTAYSTAFRETLQMIKSEGADFIMHQGDFDYEDNPVGFFTDIANADLDNDGKTVNADGSLDLDYPYFVAEGNHDYNNWPSTCGHVNGCYVNYFKQILQNLNITPDDPNLDDQAYSFVYKGIKLVFAGEELETDAYAAYVDTKLKENPMLWEICSWHKNQEAMQVGGKHDDMGWPIYENCKNAGAIIATGHEHSYSRTKTLSNMQNQIVDAACPNPNELCLNYGKTFAFVSGVGGGDVRYQTRCLPYTYPYGCNGEWASIYSLNHPLVPNTVPNNTSGVLFIEFNVDGNERKANGYFKLNTGQVIDTFSITNSKNLNTPTPTNTPTLTPTPAIKKMTLNFTDDTFVSASNPTTNMSSQTTIKINNSPKKIAYLRLNLTSLAGKNIKMARIKMYVSNASTGTLNLKATSNSWSNSKINYNNRPALGSSYGTFQRTETGMRYLNITNLVNINKGKIISVGIDISNSDEFIFNSKDAILSKRPIIEVEYY